MKIKSCTTQQISKFAIGSMLVAAALGMTVISIIILPIVGFALVIPILILAAYVFRLHLNDQCEIDLK